MRIDGKQSELDNWYRSKSIKSDAFSLVILALNFFFAVSPKERERKTHTNRKGKRKRNNFYCFCFVSSWWSRGKRYSIKPRKIIEVDMKHTKRNLFCSLSELQLLDCTDDRNQRNFSSQLRARVSRLVDESKRKKTLIHDCSHWLSHFVKMKSEYIKLDFLWSCARFSSESVTIQTNTS